MQRTFFLKKTSLVFDAGNTQTKVGVFQDGTLQSSHIIKMDDMEIQQHFPGDKWTEMPVIVSNVRQENDLQVKEINRLFTKSTILTHKTPIPLQLNVPHPDTIGTDRIAICTGAVAIGQREKAKLVIATGTCITYNYINTNGDFTGGAISPGYQMRLNAMHRQTGRLPLVIAGNKMIAEIADSTKENLESGVFYGIKDEIDGRIQRFKEVNSDGEIFITGGHHLRLVNTTKYSIFANPNLSLIGLQKILEFNL
jgi:type III pantothenate kinase